MNGRSRWVLAVLLIASLALSATLRIAAGNFKQSQRLVRPVNSSQKLSSLNSYSLGLFLGGMRGPLVMYLWTSAENQKAAKDLEDIDTKIEMIRLLQAEFDSVHIFQIWNKAYNLSVQMASKSNKYATILSGLDYARDVDRERPDNVNILTQIAGLYFDKLGGSAEKRYYIERIRAETLPAVRVTLPAARTRELLGAAGKLGISMSAQEIGSDPATKNAVVLMRLYDAALLKKHFTGDDVRYEVRSRQSLRPTGEAARRSYHDQMLDENGHILPELLKPDGRVKPAVLAPGDLWNNGAELQYLEPYDKEGFPYGLPPQALAYAYYKRSVVLRQSTGQKHLQLSDRIIDERPAVTLKGWAEEEWERGRRLELGAFGQKLPAERLMYESATEALSSAQLVDRNQLDQMLFCYTRAVQLIDDALGKEFKLLADTDMPVWDKFSATRDTLAGQRALIAADIAYMRAISDPAGMSAKSYLKVAADNYQKAADQFHRVILKYYYADDLAAAVYGRYTDQNGKPLTKMTIDRIDPKLLPQMDAEVRARIAAPANKGGKGGQDGYEGDRADYEGYLQRAKTRQKAVVGMLSATTQPAQ